MARAFDGSYAPDTMPMLPCGGVPEFDHESGCAYRCWQCMAVLGSMAMSASCKAGMESPEYRRAVKDWEKQDARERRNF